MKEYGKLTIRDWGKTMITIILVIVGFVIAMIGSFIFLIYTWP